jgi:hypothetical protein
MKVDGSRRGGVEVVGVERRKIGTAGTLPTFVDERKPYRVTRYTR